MAKLIYLIVGTNAIDVLSGGKVFTEVGEKATIPCHLDEIAETCIFIRFFKLFQSKQTFNLFNLDPMVRSFVMSG